MKKKFLLVSMMSFAVWMCFNITAQDMSVAQDVAVEEHIVAPALPAESDIERLAELFKQWSVIGVPENINSQMLTGVAGIRVASYFQGELFADGVVWVTSAQEAMRNGAAFDAPVDVYELLGQAVVTWQKNSQRVWCEMQGLAQVEPLAWNAFVETMCVSVELAYTPEEILLVEGSEEMLLQRCVLGADILRVQGEFGTDAAALWPAEFLESGHSFSQALSELAESQHYLSSERAAFGKGLRIWRMPTLRAIVDWGEWRAQVLWRSREPIGSFYETGERRAVAAREFLLNQVDSLGRMTIGFDAMLRSQAIQEATPLQVSWTHWALAREARLANSDAQSCAAIESALLGAIASLTSTEGELTELKQRQVISWVLFGLSELPVLTLEGLSARQDLAIGLWQLREQGEDVPLGQHALELAALSCWQARTRETAYDHLLRETLTELTILMESNLALDVLYYAVLTEGYLGQVEVADAYVEQRNERYRLQWEQIKVHQILAEPMAPSQDTWGGYFSGDTQGVLRPDWRSALAVLCQQALVRNEIIEVDKQSQMLGLRYLAQLQVTDVVPFAHMRAANGGVTENLRGFRTHLIATACAMVAWREHAVMRAQ